MFRTFLIFCFITLLSLQLTGCLGSKDTPSGPSAAGQVNAALASGKPVLLDFGADGCPSCVQMKPTIYRIITEYNDKLQVVMVDTSVDRELSAAYKVRAIPTYVFVAPDGSEAGRQMGFIDSNIFIDYVESFIKQHSPLTAVN